MQLPDFVEETLNRLEKQGYEAYVVGGCVRDGLRGVSPADWDICTNATPDNIQGLFADVPCILTGVQHGTVTVLMKGQPLEITTYRTEGAYSDTRHPDTVCFVSSLTDDLSRRDFTVNAMAYHPIKGLVDIFGGRHDLRTKTLRCVGVAEERFAEDPLRILRGLRFASCLGFNIAEETAVALESQEHGLLHIAHERVREEWNRLLLGEYVGDVLLRFSSVIMTVFPEFESAIGFEQQNPYHCYDVYEHTVHAVSAAQNRLAVRLALWLHDVGKPHTFSLDEQSRGHFYGHAKQSERIAEQILKRLRYDRHTVERVLTLVRHHDVVIEESDKAVKRWLNRLGEEAFFDLIEVQRGDVSAQSPAVIPKRLERLKQIADTARRLLQEKQCFSLKDLAVDGDDVMSLGIPAGKKVGELLSWALEQVIDGTLENDKSELLNAIAKNT